MLERGKSSASQTEASEIISTLPPRSQHFISLDDQTFILSKSSEDVRKLWLQNQEAIKVYEGEYNQLIYQMNEGENLQIELIERNGYPDVERGEEIDFLVNLLLKGKLTEIEK
jgi:hypothetical protein